MPRRTRSLLHDDSRSAASHVRASAAPEAAGLIQPALEIAHPEAALVSPWASAGMRRQSALQLSRTVGNHQLNQMLHVQRTQAGPPTLRPGSRGPAVQQLQSQLNTQGASLTPDGIYGPATQQAVRTFQQSHGLAADGIVGPNTWAALGGQSTPAGSTGTAGPAGATGGAQLATGLSAKLAEVQALSAQLQARQPSAVQPDSIAGTLANPTILPSPQPQHDSWWDDVTGAVGDVASDVGSAVGDVASDVGGAVGDVAEDAWDTVTDVATDVGGAVAGVASDVGSAVGGAAGNAWDTVTDVANDVGSAVGGAADSVWNTVTDVANDVGNAIGDVASDVGGAAENAWDFVKEVTGMDQIQDKITEVVNTVRETVNGIVDRLVDVARDVANGVGDLAQKVLEFISDPSKVLQALDDLLKKLREMVTGEEAGDEAVSGEFAAETMANATTCHDSPASKQPASATPGRPLTLQFHFHMAPETVQETPEVASNFDRMYGLSTNTTYVSDITMNDSDIVQVPATDFGTTGARVGLNGKFTHASRDTDTVYVDAKLKHRQSWAITSSPGRENIPITLDNITQENWGEAALDIDPESWKTNLGAPLRKKYWCKDITEAHEQFHTSDADGYMRDKALPMLESEFSGKQINVPWIIDREAEITKQLKQVSEEMTTRATGMRDRYMAQPASEQRAYANDAPSYEARAFTIRSKAKQEGWDKKTKP